MSRRFSAASCLISSLCMGASFAAYAASTAPVAFVYVSSNYKANTAKVYGYAAAADGKLTPTPYSPYSDNVYNFAVSSKYLFASGYGTNPSVYPNLYTFSIGPHGYLTLVDAVDQQTFPGNTCSSPGPMSVDRTGADLYTVANTNANCADEDEYLSLDISKTTGKLTYLSEINDVDGYSFPLIFLKNNELAYTEDGQAAATNSNFVCFKRSSSGSLEQISISADYVYSSEGFYQPQNIAVDSTNHMAVVQVAPWSEWQLSSYTIDESNGNLTTTSTEENMPRISVAGVRGNVGGVFATSMSPSGKLVAVGGETGLQIFHFNGAALPTVDTGALTSDAINQVFWDNDNHLYAISNSAGKLFVFTVTPTSAKEAPGSPYSIAAPAGLAVVPK